MSETIVETKLKEVRYAMFHVADALEAIKADIMEETRWANHGCTAADLQQVFA